MSNNAWVVIKAIVAAFVGGFATGALTVTGQVISGSPIDYRAAFQAGVAGGVVGVILYIKAPPSEMGQAGKSSTPFGGGLSILMIGVLAVGSLGLSGCGNERTLAQVGYDVNSGINTVAHAVKQLHDSGAAFKGDDAGYRSFLLLIDRTQTASDQFNAELDKIKELSGSNKDEVLRYLDTLATTLVEARAIAGVKLPPNLLTAISYGQTALNGARIIIAAWPVGKSKSVKQIRVKPVELAVAPQTLPPQRSGVAKVARGVGATALAILTVGTVRVGY